MSVNNKTLNKEAVADVGWLVSSVTRMVRPVVRLCIGRMSCNAFVNVIKRIYVEEATRHLAHESPEKKVTKSALALLSGLDSRAVDGIMQEKAELNTAGDIRPEAAILEAWASDRTYLDPETEGPKILPIYGKGISFQTLVSRTAGRNVTCHTVLDKLTQSNHVRVIDDNFVEILSRHYSAAPAVEKAIFESGTFAVSRLADTVSHNLEANHSEDKWLQQERWSVKISRDNLDKVRSELRELTEAHILSVVTLLEPYEDPVRTHEHCSAGLGWYYWESTSD